MADVARAVGATSRDVALVLAADPRVPTELRRAISDTIIGTKYRPLQELQARLGRPPRFAIVFKTHRGEDPATNPFYAPIASAIAISCVKEGATIAQETLVVDEDFNLAEVPPSLLSGKYDGAFLVGVQVDGRTLDRLHELCPIVLVDGYSTGDALDSVVTDNLTGGRLAVEHLIHAGHRDIAIIGSELVCYPSIQDRREGYIEALQAHGLPLHCIDASYVTIEAVTVLTIDYLRAHPEVTAVFAVNDPIAIDFMQAARYEGFRFPADISLVGFDDIDMAGLVMPSLTTLSIDKSVMGRAGFALLAHRLETPGGEPVGSVVMPRIVERESVAPPKPR